MSKNGVGTRGAGFGLDAELARKVILHAHSSLYAKFLSQA